MKRIISCALSLLMAISTVICVDLSALAEEHVHDFHGGMCMDYTCKEADASYVFVFEDLELNEYTSHTFFNYGDSVAFRINVDNTDYYEIYKYSSSHVLGNYCFYDENFNIVSKSSIAYLEANKMYYLIFVQMSYNVAGEFNFKLKKHEHSLSKSRKNPTCKSAGYYKEECHPCGYKKIEEYPPVDHEFANGKCYYCGLVDDSYVEVVTTVELGKQIDGEISAISEKDYYSYTADKDCILLLTSSKGDSISNLMISMEQDGSFLKNYTDEAIVNAKAGSTYKFSIYSKIRENKGSYSILLQEHEHNFTETKRREPTCTSNGVADYKCEDCSYTYSEKLPVNPNNHQYDVNGECTVCGGIDPDYTITYTMLDFYNTISFDAIINKKYYFTFTPDETEYYTFKISSNTSVSVDLYDCNGKKLCDYSIIDYAITKNLNKGERYELVVYSQSSDNNITIQPVSIHTHSFNVKTTVKPNCIKSGLQEYKCTNCGYSETKVLSATPDTHCYVDDVCKDCGAVDENYEIIYTDIVVNDEAAKYVLPCGGGNLYFKFTVNEDGRYAVKGFEHGTSSYDRSVLIVFDENNNILEKHGYVDNIGGYYDLESGKQYYINIKTNSCVNNTITIYLSISNHEHKIITNGTPANCKDNGKVTRSCYNCDYSETIYSTATGEHNYVQEVVAPTCSTPGYTQYFCTTCENAYIYDYKAPDGITHNFVNNFCKECDILDVDGCTFPLTKIGDILDVTITKSNKYTYSVLVIPDESDYYYFTSVGAEDSYCTVYDKFGNIISENDDYNSKVYDFSVGVLMQVGEPYVVEFGAYSNDQYKVYSSKHIHYYCQSVHKATCGDKGYTIWECSCGEYYFSDFVNPTGEHKYVKGDVVAPTCDDYGYTEYYCSKCYDFYETDKTPPTGNHKYENGYCAECGRKEVTPFVPTNCAINEGQKIALELSEKGDKTAIQFTPTKSGTYIIETKGFNDVDAVFEDTHGKEIDADGDSGASGNIMLVEELEEGKTYRIVVEMIAYENGITTISVNAHTHDYSEYTIPADCGNDGLTILTCKTCFYSTVIDNCAQPDKHKFNDGICTICGNIDYDYYAVEINDGDELIVPERKEQIYKYVAKADTTVIFKSNSIYDPMGEVVDENGKLVELGYANGENMDFVINFNAKAGRTYYLFASACFGEYKVNISHLHSFVDTVVKPTCDKQGYTVYSCQVCSKNYRDNIVNALDHKISSSTTKATTSANGKIVKSCKVCKKILSTTVIPKVSSVKLSATSYTYNGKVNTPAVTVKDSKGKTLKKNTDYTVSYAKGRKNVGKYAIKVTFEGNYSGTKTLYFTIKPKATSISSVSAKSKGFTVKWKKQSTQTTGYQIQYSTSSKFSNAKTVTVSKNSTTSKTVSKLKAKKKYYVRVRTYKTVNGTKYYSAWSKYRTVKTKA